MIRYLTDTFAGYSHCWHWDKCSPLSPSSPHCSRLYVTMLLKTICHNLSSPLFDQAVSSNRQKTYLILKRVPLLSAGDLNILRVYSHDNATGRCLEGLSESEKQGSHVLHFLDTDQSSPMLLSYIFIEIYIIYMNCMSSLNAKFTMKYIFFWRCNIHFIWYFHVTTSSSDSY